MDKKNTRGKFVGLIVLTILVVVAIVLIVYFVNESTKVEKLQVNEIAKTTRCELKVINVENYAIDDEYMSMCITIHIKAKKNITLDDLDISISDGEKISTEGFEDKIYKNTEKDFKITYKVKKYKEEYLLFKNYKIALGCAM